MRRTELLFGYSFAIGSVALPYLIEHLSGSAVAATWAFLFCLFFAGVLLFLGYRSKKEDEQQETADGLLGAVLPTPPTAELQQSMNVQLKPSGGKRPDQLLEVRNDGRVQHFHAQCRLVARRNDPNRLNTGTFDLKWDSVLERSVSIARGESRNLLIATATPYKAHGYDEVELWELKDGAQHRFEVSRWLWEEKLPPPEYDMEVILFGDESEGSHVETFTIRFGSITALEMVRLHRIVEASDSVPLQSDPRITIEIDHVGDKGIFSSTGIRIKNVGGSEVHKLRLSSLSIAGKVVRFEENIPVIAPAETSQVIYPEVDGVALQLRRNLIRPMMDDWDNQGGIAVQMLTFKAEATYEDYKGVRYVADWSYEFYPIKYRMKKMRETKGSVVPDVTGPCLLVSAVRTRKQSVQLH